MSGSSGGSTTKGNGSYMVRYSGKAGGMGGHSYKVVIKSKTKLQGDGKCKDMGCRGKKAGSGLCQATSEDCTSRGEYAAGFYTSCGWSSCVTGWQVRCVKCDAGYKWKIDKSYARPKHIKVTVKWKAPGIKITLKGGGTSKGGGSAKAPAEVTIPKFSIGGAIGASASAKYGSMAAAEAAWKAYAASIKIAMQQIAQYKSMVCDAEKLKLGLETNITYFAHKESSLAERAVQERAGAVRFAKKRVLANITLMRAKRAMDDAFMGEHGAEDGAKRAAAYSVNARLHKVYYKKKLIDQAEYLLKAQSQLSVGKITINTAFSNLAQAKRAYYRWKTVNTPDLDKAKLLVHHKTELGEKFAIKKAMEQAYAEASPQFGVDSKTDRNITNVPTWGEGGLFTAVGTVACDCMGQDGCACR